jgi:hypothetical protein
VPCVWFGGGAYLLKSDGQNLFFSHFRSNYNLTCLMFSKATNSNTSIESKKEVEAKLM